MLLCLHTVHGFACQWCACMPLCCGWNGQEKKPADACGVKENELRDNRKWIKALTPSPPPPAATHLPSQHSVSPPTIVPNSPSVHPTNHKPVSIAMSQLSGVIKFLAAKRMKEDREGGKSRAGESGGGWGNMRSKMPVNTKAEQGFVIGE